MKFFKLIAIHAAAAAVMVFSSVCSVFAGDKTAQEIVNDMKIGWNLGNSFDSVSANGDIPSETYWGNPVVTQAAIDAVYNKGFRTVRLPVTWYQNCDADGKISEARLARVKEVVDYCRSRDMYVILNIHHEDEKIIPDAAHKVSSKQWVINLWSQIAAYFKDYDQHLIFETMNEPRLVGASEEWTTGSYETRVIISELDQAAVDTIRNTGGNNAQRLIMCPSNAAKIPAETGFTLPDDPYVALSVHNYSPYDFALNGKESSAAQWGSDSDKAQLESELKGLYYRFVSKGVPVVIGEMGATDKQNTAERAEWAEFYTKTAAEYGITCVVWDNNDIYSDKYSNMGDSKYSEHFGLLNRSDNSWYYPTVAEALVKGANEAQPYTPSPEDAYITEYYSGSAALSSYDPLYITSNLPALGSGYLVAVDYTGQRPWLVFQKGDAWTQFMQPDKVENGTAYFSFETIAAKLDYSTQEQMFIQASGGDCTVTRVYAIAPHLNGDVTNDGRVNNKDAAVLLKYICGVSTAGTAVAYGNYNQKDGIDLLDVVSLLNENK
ncbi:MAG: cellulase family glycosylhydrolase [Firmicutes bacterium]|nr:cellulase family glycosylhydrolase [Bacillota bacterium]